MTAQWPADVPLDFIRQGYNEQDEDDQETFEAEKGPPLYWGGPVPTTTLYKGSIPCTKAQKKSLNDFVRIRLGGVGLRFRRIVPGEASETADFCFVGKISWSEVTQDLWYGQCTLRRLP